MSENLKYRVQIVDDTDVEYEAFLLTYELDSKGEFYRTDVFDSTGTKILVDKWFAIDATDELLDFFPWEIKMEQACTCGAKHTSNPKYHLDWCDLK